MSIGAGNEQIAAGMTSSLERSEVKWQGELEQQLMLMLMLMQAVGVAMSTAQHSNK